MTLLVTAVSTVRRTRVDIFRICTNAVAAHFEADGVDLSAHAHAILAGVVLGADVFILTHRPCQREMNTALSRFTGIFRADILVVAIRSALGFANTSAADLIQGA